MNARVAISTLAVFGGMLTLAGAAELTAGPPTPTPAPARVTVQMTSATLGDDCGGGRPSVPTKTFKSEKSDAAFDRKGKAKRRCEQTSMQLSVSSPSGGAPTELHVKSVELLDETGTRLDSLTPRTPTVWSASGVYTPWNERVDPANELSVSYTLSQPDWSRIEDRWNKTFVLRAVVTVAGADQTVQRDVVVETATSLPPNVKT